MKNFFTRYKSFIAAGLSFAAALAAGYMLQMNEIKKAEEKADEAQAFITEGEAEGVLPQAEKAERNETELPEAFEFSSEPEPPVTMEELSQDVAASGTLSFSMPLSGAIIKSFSEQPLYSVTLDDWRSHEAIDIEAEEGDAVYSAERGTVAAVGIDPLFGVYVRIDHGNGTESLYANMHSETTVQERQTIEKHHQIGYVGSTSISEQAERAHLHFEIKVDGKRKNPEHYLK